MHMKKILAATVSAIMLVTMFTGCGSTSSSNNSTASDLSSTTSSVDSTASTDVSSETSSAISSDISSIASSIVSAASSITSTAVSSKTSTATTVAAVASTVTSGTYTSARSVVLSTATAGATIYYTTDGSNPTASSTKYSSAISVATTTTIKAIAVKSGITSAVSTFAIVINVPKVALTGNVVMRGSSALYPLTQLAVGPFIAKYGNLFGGTIDCGAGEGSGAGLDALNSGTSGCNIGNSDVTLDQAGKNYAGFVDHQVATVAVAVVVAPDVADKFKNTDGTYRPIKASELLKIYNGAITNWTDVSGSNNYDKPIAVCYRKKGSGTRTLFQTYGIPGTAFDETTGPYNGSSFIYTNASTDLASKILSQAGAIGYETLPYCGALAKLPVLFDLDASGKPLSNPPTTGVTCTYTNVNNGTYKIWGYEHMYTKGTPADTSAAKAFIDYITSADFQQIILGNGYGLVSNLSEAAKASH